MDDGEGDPIAQPADRFLRIAENVVYALIGLFLALSAVVALVTVGYHLATDLGTGAEEAVTKALDGLLLVFIVLELLAGVRATMVERKLVAEPFLVVGIIASIKEIVVLALQARTGAGADDPAFQAAMVEIGVLGVLVLTLSAANYLVRLKEREPTEG